MNGTDIPRTIADRIYVLLLLAYPSEFRDRFGAGMRYAFSLDRETATAAGLPSHLRFWFTTIIDTVRSGLAERSERRPHRPWERRRMKSWLVVDWRDGWRSLRATPAVTAVAVLSLALGIGANTALFSIFNSLNLKALPVTEADRLVLLADDSWTNPIWEEIRGREEQIAGGAFAWSNERFNLSPAGEADPVDGIYASDSSLDGRSTWWLNIMLRLRRDQTLAQATDWLRGVQDQIRVATMPQRGKDIQASYLRDPFTLVPASSGRSALRARYEQPLRAPHGVVGLLPARRASRIDPTSVLRDV